MSASADALGRIAGAAERLADGGPDLEPYRLEGKEYDALGRQVPRNPWRGKTGVVLALRMGMAAQFKKRVPGEYVMGSFVMCVCGELNDLEVGGVAECVGCCERWFLHTGESVRVARWAREDDETAAAA